MDEKETNQGYAAPQTEFTGLSPVPVSASGLKAGNTTKNLAPSGAFEPIFGPDPLGGNAAKLVDPLENHPFARSDFPPEPSRSDVTYLLSRILGLEERLDRMEDRFALFNVKSAYKI